MSEAQKRPCSICHRWFRPDSRIGSRQRACRNPDCQKSRRKKKQKAWREKHPDYFNARRILDRSKQDRAPEPLRLGPPLNQLPWDIAQSQFGVQGADFIGIFGRVLLAAAQSQFEAYVTDDAGFPDTLPDPSAQSQIQPVRESVRIGTEGREAGVSSTGPPI
jgi:hypothetical protein